jgi:hypothetical protein
MKKEEQRFLIKYFWMKNWDPKKIHPELVTTLGAVADGWSQIQIWLQKLRDGDLSYEERLRTGRPPLTLSRNLRHFFKNILLPGPECLRSTS